MKANEGEKLERKEAPEVQSRFQKRKLELLIDASQEPAKATSEPVPKEKQEFKSKLLKHDSSDNVVMVSAEKQPPPDEETKDLPQQEASDNDKQQSEKFDEDSTGKCDVAGSANSNYSKPALKVETKE
jgi:hypothetical protein